MFNLFKSRTLEELEKENKRLNIELDLAFEALYKAKEQEDKRKKENNTLEFPATKFLSKYK